MHTPSHHHPPLAEFVDLAGLQPLVANIFPTAESIKWFGRVHRAKLVSAGALIGAAGRLHYHPERFQQVVAEIGAEAAAVSAEKGGE